MSLTETTHTHTDTFQRIIPQRYDWRNASRNDLLQLAHTIAASPFHMAVLNERLEAGIFRATRTEMLITDMIQVLNDVYKFEDLVHLYKPEIYLTWLAQLSLREAKRVRRLTAALEKGHIDSGGSDDYLAIWIGLTDDDPTEVRRALLREKDLSLTELGRQVLAERDAARAAEQSAQRAAQAMREAALRESQEQLIDVIQAILTQDGRGDYVDWFKSKLDLEQQRQLSRPATLSTEKLQVLIRNLRYYEEELQRRITAADDRKARVEAERAARRAEKKAESPTAQPQAPTWQEKQAHFKTGKANPQGVPGEAPQRGKTVAGAGKKNNKKK